jgi:putative hydrolase of the HAD superfamily
MSKITTLFLDIGGVLLTNGWDSFAREKAIVQFKLDKEDFQKRHKQWYDEHEKGIITIDDYLNKVVFWTSRQFSMQQFKDFMLSQSQPKAEMLDFISHLKKEKNLRVAVVSNEGRYLAEYRIKKFNLTSFIDDFFISCFVGYQKPDPHIFKLALDVLQVPIEQVLYIDDRSNLIEAASKMGFCGIVHVSLDETKKHLAGLFACR